MNRTDKATAESIAKRFHAVGSYASVCNHYGYFVATSYGHVITVEQANKLLEMICLASANGWPI